MGTVHIPTLLDGILEATAAKAGAEARITTLRAALEAEGRRRLDVEGAAPSWNAPKLGKVRLDPPGEFEAYVEDADAFASYAAEHHPTEVTAVVTINASELVDALKALEFIGVLVHEARLEVRPAWRKPFLEALSLGVVEERDESAQLVRTVVAVDPKTSETVPGIGATRDAAKLVVTLDRDRRTAAIKSGEEGARYVVEAASSEDDEAAVDLTELDTRRKELEALHADQLATIAKGHDLGSSGTKAALAERIARAELATGHVIRPASTVGNALAEALVDGLNTAASESQGRIIEDLRATTHVEPVPLERLQESNPARWGTPLPEGTEVEEVSEVPTEDPSEPGPGPFTDEEGNAYPPTLAVVPGGLTAAQEGLSAERLTKLLDGLSREVLRQYAKAIGLSAAGAKADVIDRLVAEGVTVSAVNEHARRNRPTQEPTS